MNDDKVIGKAIVFIENHLYEPIAACDAAEAVSYSYYHFHRYFSAVMGETIGSYIRSRRLTQAAWDLIHSDKKIIDIGLSLYFQTAESFTRSFKDRYSLTPSEYRRNGINVLIGNRQPAQMPDQAVITYAGLQPEIVMVPDIHMMGISFQTTVNGKESAFVWQQFNRQIPAGLLSNRRFGVYEAGNNCSSDLFCADSKTTAFVGVEIPENSSVQKGMKIKTLCGGKYAKFIHKGTVDTLIQTYQYIWGVWFPKSGYGLADCDDFECYTERFTDAGDENSEIEIYFLITDKNVKKVK